MVRFVDYLFERFEKLQTEPGYHPKWKDVNLAANVPGWQRFRILQDRLDKVTSQATQTSAKPRASEIDAALARRQAERAAPTDAAEQERLFRQFLEWTKQQKKP
jgi:hypothetical protein